MIYFCLNIPPGSYFLCTTFLNFWPGSTHIHVYISYCIRLSNTTYLIIPSAKVKVCHIFGLPFGHPVGVSTGSICTTPYSSFLEYMNRGLHRLRRGRRATLKPEKEKFTVSAAPRETFAFSMRNGHHYKTPLGVSDKGCVTRFALHFIVLQYVSTVI